ncbi:HAD-IIA family hydrolase [Fusobacterium perfoetens]|uniref:HAD-IIA family hydrolase n=1 Tax=Fusobacterium perfoetens TaxID=852 RepID=UPI000565744F|nr:HAD-IIA family hydrolase [Fusobacterium perfoetens]MCI6153440.1 HAD-IIA family hydrolase [Fusobacterium perfoetens]MDY3238417.1 HAD-IIA family hydrolase [Fusobacterium perfoetens]
MIENKKYFLLDMDGTLYLGNQLIEGAKEFLEKIKLKNKKYIFMTNNSSKNREAYVEKLKKLGIDANVEEIFGSTEATIIYLNKIKKGAKIFLLGNELLEEAFLKAGFEIIKEKDKEIDFVVLGFDTTLTYDKIWKACDYIFAGIPYIATHPDFVCPLDGGKCMPDTGSMIEMIKAVTGKTPLVIGKPNKHIIDGIIEKYNISKEETVIVGDRLYTDIRTGLDNGITSVLVMSGETTEETLKETIYKPDYIFNSVKDMIDII